MCFISVICAPGVLDVPCSMRALLSKFFACLRKSRSLCTLLVPNSEETRGHGQSMMNSRLSEMMYAKHSEIPNNNNLLLVERSKKVYYHHDIYIYIMMLIFIVVITIPIVFGIIMRRHRRLPI